MIDKQIVNIGMSLEGRYTIQKLDKSGKVISEFVVMNLITDTGMNLYGSNSPSFNLAWCRVGTGTGTPAFTDTSLGNEIGLSDGSPSKSTTREASPDWYTETSITYNFALGSVVGNITEVGVSTTNTGNLFSRALFKDELGNPVSITVLSDEQLRVVYTLRAYAPSGDILDTVDGQDITIRPASFNNVSFGWLAEATNYSTTLADFRLLFNNITSAEGAPNTSGALNATSITWSSYTSGSFTRDLTLSWNTSVGDGSTYKGVYLVKSSHRWQVGISPGVVKTDENILDIVLRFSWARVS